MKFLRWFFGLFSQYVDPFEKKVDKFFKGVKSTDSHTDVRARLLKLMQENLIVVNLWMEKKYKGYKYLSKSARRKMYKDVLMIKSALDGHCKNMPVGESEIREILLKKNLLYPHGNEEKILYLFQIMKFLSPGLNYHYIKTSSFGKLLRDPGKAKMEGDCNQIVTLYAYLYSLKFPVEDLKIKLLPEHVCLHFHGIDIEATSGEFEKYGKKGEIFPITEIVSTNLLDLSDFRESTQSIGERDILKSAQLCHAISSNREVVEKNLNIAYHNLGIAAMKANNFDSAIFFFAKTSDQKFLKDAYRNASIYYMTSHNFSKARYYADKSKDSNLLKTVRHNEGVYYLEKEKWDAALKVFSDLGDDKMKKACYGQQYNKLAEKISNVRTLKEAKKYKSTYKKMIVLAQKLGDSSTEKDLRETLSQI